MRIFLATLETIVGCGHNWEAVNFLTLGASVRGSNEYTESGGGWPVYSTSKNSPGYTVVHVGGERSTMARRAVELIATGCWDLYLWIGPSPRIT